MIQTPKERGAFLRLARVNLKAKEKERRAEGRRERGRMIRTRPEVHPSGCDAEIGGSCDCQLSRRADNRAQRTARTNMLLTFRDEPLTQSQWAERLGISDKTIWRRINDLGWTVEEALSTPVKK